VVVPYNTGPSLSDTSAGTLISDDGGISWLASSNLVPGGNECVVAPTADGRLILDMRPSDVTPISARLASYSTDDGQSWSVPPLRPRKSLVRCEGSMLAVCAPDEAGDNNRAPTVLLFSHPATRRIRGNLTIWRSDDSGASWQQTKTVQEGPCAYSSMQPAASPGMIHIAYEMGISSGIRVATIDILKQLQGDGAAPMFPVPIPVKPE
jgi:sialidase-1